MCLIQAYEPVSETESETEKKVDHNEKTPLVPNGIEEGTLYIHIALLDIVYSTEEYNMWTRGPFV